MKKAMRQGLVERKKKKRIDREDQGDDPSDKSCDIL